MGEEVLPQDRERLRLAPGDALAIDLDQFEAAVAAGRLGAAIDTSAGDFLEKASLGEPAFDMWVEQERARLRARLAQVLADAAGQASASGRWAEAVAYTHRLMTVAPFEAASAQLAATTLIAAGRRHEARELMKQFAATLDAELGLPLPQELQALLNRLERQPVVEAASARTPLASREAELPFVGREAQLSQLVTLCRTTAEESGGFALVKGGAGMGKTRLLTELVAHIKSLGKVTVLHGREHVAGIQLPYAVFAEALRPLARAPGIVGASKHLLAEAARLLPELRDELELPAVTDVEDEAGRLRFFEGIAALMDAAAFERPIVLLIDDVHLAGPSTLELLLYLCARLGRSAVTFVLALRPDDAPASMLSRLESVARVDSQTHPGRSMTIDLQAISHESAREAVSRATDAMGVATPTIEMVVDRANGVPARLVEAVRRIYRGEPIPSASITLRETVVDRAARLTSVQRRLLFVVAIIGRPTPKQVLGGAAHLPRGAIDDALDTLRAEGLVEVTTSGDVDVSDDVRRTALELAGPSTRAFLSGWVADELRARSAPPAELARFYAAAGQAKAAFEQSRLAAFSALAVGALPEATHHLQVARGFAQSADDSAATESLLNALGAGHRQIHESRRPAPATTETQEQPDVERMGESGRLAVLFPNWRVLLGAAVATLIVSAFVLADRTSATPTGLSLSESDTLLVAEDASGRDLRTVTGSFSRGFVVSQRRAAQPSTPAWVDSMARPWVNPLVAPRTHRVAVERVTTSGSDLFLISADRRDTTSLLVSAGDARALHWSPDGRWLLASLAPGDGSYDVQLLAFRDDGRGFQRRVIDATAQRSVSEASWSPDGTRLAWVSRVGAGRQLEVFVSNADGSNTRNVSRHPADDHHIAWSPDGNLLAFTSNRDGNAELYALSLLENRLWRLTFDPAQDDVAHFSADSRLVAFESTRGGAAAVYIMPALGGDAKRIAAPSPIRPVRWSGRPARYVDRVLIEQPGRIPRGDTATLRLVAFDQFDEPLVTGEARWRLLDSALARAVAGSERNELRIVPLSNGIARIVASVGGWRSDTALVALGMGPITILGRDGSSRFWRSLGRPSPTVLTDNVVLSSDREWDSGVLSGNTVPLVPGFVLQTTLQLPLSESRDPAAGATVALVEPEDSTTIDFDAPQFLRHASVSWSAESARLVYAVGREFFSEAVSLAVPAPGSPLTVQMRIEHDSTISFRVAGQQRWRSSLRVITPRRSPRAQVWVSARATGDRAQLRHTTIRIEPVAASTP